MEDVITICSRCSWIHVDGAGEFCNGCGARHHAGAPQAVAMTRPRATFGADLMSASLLLTLFALLIAAAR